MFSPDMHPVKNEIEEALKRFYDDCNNKSTGTYGSVPSY